MRTIDAVRRPGVGIGPDRSIEEGAALMERAGVGALVIVDDQRVVGIATDRDLVRRGLATGMSRDARIDAVMSTPVITIEADAELRDALPVFRANAIRRLVVVRGEELAGMLALDDLLVDLASDLGDLVRPITAEVLFGHRDSPVPATTEA